MFNPCLVDIFYCYILHLQVSLSNRDLFGLDRANGSQVVNIGLFTGRSLGLYILLEFHDPRYISGGMYDAWWC